MIFWIPLALAKRPPAPVCDVASVEAAVSMPLPALVEALGRACDPLPMPLLEWLLAESDARPDRAASKACSRAKNDLKQDLSPGFEARMLGVAKACKLSEADPLAAVGPSALLLGEETRSLLLAGSVPPAVAQAIADRLSGRTGPRRAGRYGGMAAWADSLELPVASRAALPVPIERLLSLEGGERLVPGELTILAHRANHGSGLANMVALEAGPRGAWIAVLPPSAGRREHDPVYGIRVEGAAPSAVRIRVESERIEVAYGQAGDTFEVEPDALLSTVAAIRETLLAAQEFGREPPPDRVWVHPVGTVSVQRVVEVLDALLDDDGTPRFAAISLSVEGSLVEWPEEVDAAGLR